MLSRARALFAAMAGTTLLFLAGSPAFAGAPAVAAAGRGYPWLNLADAVPIVDGAAPRALAGAEPQALASADLDEDGVADLIVGYATAHGGRVAVYRGFLGAIYPNDPHARSMLAQGQATGAPFLPGAETFGVPEDVDFVAAGDFDADGHRDVVAAKLGAAWLYLLRGDGHGELADAETIRLPGAVTSLVSGEINRRDGLEDVVAAVTASTGPALLVFEGPDGALRSPPETLELPAAATDLALGQLDDDPALDLAATAGNELRIVHGRDRRLSHGAAERAAVPAASVSQIRLGYGLAALAIGEFTVNPTRASSIALLASAGDLHVLERTRPSASSSPGWNEVTSLRGVASGGVSSVPGRALIAVRTSSGGGEQALVVDRGARALRLGHAALSEAARATGFPDSITLDTASAPVAALAMRLNGDAFGDLVVIQRGHVLPSVVTTQAAHVFTVNAIAQTPDADLTDNMCSDCLRNGASCQLDGNNKPILNGVCSLRAATDQANQSPGADLIQFSIGSGAKTIEFDGNLPGSSFSGDTTVDGTTQPGFDGRPAIELKAVGGLGGLSFGFVTAVVRGVILNGGSVGGIGIQGGSGSIIEGNYIGTNASGLGASGNTNGVSIAGAGVTIGGTSPAARNVISGNGIGIFDDGSSTLSIQGNYIGTDVTGTKAVGNTFRGVQVGSPGTVITGNVISGNGTSTSHANLRLDFDEGGLVQGNLIGCDVTGTQALGGAGAGILVGNGSTGVTIRNNVVSGNGDIGIYVNNFLQSFVVQGNKVGTQINGTGALGNGSHGFYVAANSANGGTIGGATLGAGNTIAFNGGKGITMVFGRATISRNAIYGNGGIGIDLGDDGVTNNDAGDADGFPADPNLYQNFPVITSATSSTVSGTLNSTASTSFTLEFFSSPSCDSSGKGEGRTYRGSTQVNTNGSGNATFTNVPFASTVPAGQAVTATATDPSGNTSEFSGCTTAGGTTSAVLETPSASLRAGAAIQLEGGGITPGSVLKVYLATSSGPLDVIPNGLSPTDTTATSWSGTLPFPWPISPPFDTSLGNGFVSLQLVRTDQGFDNSNLVGAVLIGNPAKSIPSITAINGVPLSATSSSPSIATSNVEGLLALGAANTITGEAFASPVVNVFTASGNVGPLTPTTSTANSITFDLPGNAPVGPGSVQVVNTTDFKVSNSTSIPIGAPITVSAVQVNGATISVTGTGFNSLTVINLFASQGGNVVNVGGLAGGNPAIPLSVIDAQHFTFTRPNGLDAGAAYVEALNPPFIPFTASTGEGGAFTLP